MGGTVLGVFERGQTLMNWRAAHLGHCARGTETVPQAAATRGSFRMTCAFDVGELRLYTRYVGLVGLRPAATMRFAMKLEPRSTPKTGQG
jgi:hypothetical protein